MSPVSPNNATQQPLPLQTTDGGQICCGFMELLMKYASVVKLGDTPFLLLGKLSNELLGKTGATKPEIFEAYKQCCLENYKRNNPYLEAIYNQEEDRRDTIMQMVMSQISNIEEDKAAKTLNILRGTVKKELVPLYEAYFAEFNAYLTHDKYEAERKQAQMEQQKADKVEEPQMNYGCKYKYNHNKIVELYYTLRGYNVITDSHYESFQFEKDIANADFSSSIESFRGEYTLTGVLSLIEHTDYIERRHDWFSDVTKSVGKSPKKSSDALSGAKRANNGWLRKCCKDLGIDVDALTA